MDSAATFEFSLQADGYVFGNGTSRQIGKRAAALGARHVLLTTDKQVRGAGLLDRAEESLRDAGIKYTIWDGISTEPTFDSVHAGVRFCQQGEYDVIVAFGGGSTIDSSKAIGLLSRNAGQFSDFVDRDNLRKIVQGPPIIAVATTSGTASDFTRGSGAIDPETGIKYWMVGSNKPAFTIVDPLLTLSMPPVVTANTGTDALTQAVESFTNRMVNPVADLMNLEAVRVIGRSLRHAVANGDDIHARSEMMYAASVLVGSGFGNAGLHHVHPIAQLVGDRWRIPHGRSLGLLLPSILEFSMNGCLEKLGQVAEALGEDVRHKSPRDAARMGIEAIRQMFIDVGTHEPLRNYGVTEDALLPLAERYATLPKMAVAPRHVQSADEVMEIFLRAL